MQHACYTGGLADLCDLSYSVAVYVNKRMLLGSIFWGSISGVALIGTIGQGIRWLINGEVLRGVLAILFVGGFLGTVFVVMIMAAFDRNS